MWRDRRGGACHRNGWFLGRSAIARQEHALLDAGNMYRTGFLEGGLS